LHLADYGQFKGRVEVDPDFHELGGKIGDFAVERQLGFGRPAGFVGDDILAGRPIGSEAAAAEPFIEAGEPADAAFFGLIDPLGMNGARYG